MSNFWYSADGQSGFLNSNVALGLVTLAVGGVALYVYKKQRHDYKRNAAGIILLEIQRAERQLKLIQENVNGSNVELPENKFLMKEASWDKYGYLFVRDFTRDQWDAISDFYEKCQRFDQAVANNDSYFEKITHQTRVNLQRILADVIKENIDNLPEKPSDKQVADMNTRIGDTLKRFSDDYMAIMQGPGSAYFYNPKKPVVDAAKSLNGLNGGLSLTVIGIRLNKIASRGMFKTFWARLFGQ